MAISNITTAKMMSYDTSYLFADDSSISFPYERTYEVCNENTVCMFSGNVIKTGSYSMTESFCINNHDKEIIYIIENMRLEDSVVDSQDVIEEDYEDNYEDENELT